MVRQLTKLVVVILILVNHSDPLILVPTLPTDKVILMSLASHLEKCFGPIYKSLKGLPQFHDAQYQVAFCDDAPG